MARPSRVGGLAVHGHLELGRKLHREIARLFAAQDAIDISGGATNDVYHVDSVGEQAAVSASQGIIDVDRIEIALLDVVNKAPRVERDRNAASHFPAAGY
jgi:hypothetical protein